MICGRPAAIRSRTPWPLKSLSPRAAWLRSFTPHPGNLSRILKPQPPASLISCAQSAAPRKQAGRFRSLPSLINSGTKIEDSVAFTYCGITQSRIGVCTQCYRDIPHPTVLVLRGMPLPYAHNRILGWAQNHRYLMLVLLSLAVSAFIRISCFQYDFIFVDEAWWARRSASRPHRRFSALP